MSWSALCSVAGSALGFSAWNTVPPPRLPPGPQVGAAMACGNQGPVQRDKPGSGKQTLTPPATMPESRLWRQLLSPQSSHLRGEWLPGPDILHQDHPGSGLLTGTDGKGLMGEGTGCQVEGLGLRGHWVGKRAVLGPQGGKMGLRTYPVLLITVFGPVGCLLPFIPV